MRNPESQLIQVSWNDDREIAYSVFSNEFRDSFQGVLGESRYWGNLCSFFRWVKSEDEEI